jgi:hypothetical protein
MVAREIEHWIDHLYFALPPELALYTSCTGVKIFQGARLRFRPPSTIHDTQLASTSLSDYCAECPKTTSFSMLCCAMLCYAMLRYAMPCYAMLCCV